MYTAKVANKNTTDINVSIPLVSMSLALSDGSKHTSAMEIIPELESVPFLYIAPRQYLKEQQAKDVKEKYKISKLLWWPHTMVGI